MNAEKSEKSLPLIDLERDLLVPVRELSRRRLGRHISPATLWRWIHKGTAGGCLEAVFANGTWYSTETALADFLRRQTEAKLKSAEAIPTDSSDEDLRSLDLL